MADTTHIQRRKELAFFDPNSKRSLANLLPPEMASQMRLVWNGELGELFQASEAALLSAMARAGHPAEPLDHTLRLRFWIEFNRCQDEDWNHPKLNMALVLGRDIAREKFYKSYITDPYKLAFMLSPPVQYRQALEAALQTAMAKLQEFINKVELFNEAGNVRPHSVDKLIKIYEMFVGRIERAQGVGGAKTLKGRGTKAIIPDEEPSPGVPKSVEEQLADLKARNEELERVRGADKKKESGG